MSNTIVQAGFTIPKSTHFSVGMSKLHPVLRILLVEEETAKTPATVSAAVSPKAAIALERKPVVRQYPVVKADIDQSEARKQIPIVVNVKARNIKVRKAKEIRNLLLEELKRDAQLKKKYTGKSNKELGEQAHQLCVKVKNDLSLDHIQKAEYESRLKEALEIYDAIEITYKDYQQSHLVEGKTKIEYQKIERIVNRLAPEYSGDVEFVTLLGCFLVKNNHNKNGVYPKLPENVTDEDMAGYEARIRTIYEHLFIDLMGENNLLAIEQYKGWCKGLRKIGFDKLPGAVKGITDAFPVQLPDGQVVSLFHGENPPVRIWEMEIQLYGQENTLIDSEQIKKNHSAWILQHDCKLVDANGIFDVEKARNVCWYEKLDLPGADRLRRQCGGTREVLELGYKTLQERGVIVSKKPLVGKDKDQLHEWDFVSSDKWKRNYGDGVLLIDLITDHIVEGLRVKNPEFFDKEGKLNAKAKEVYWDLEYKSIAKLYRASSGFNAYQALARRHPYLFGNENWQIKATDVKCAKKYTSKSANEIVLELIAAEFAEKGLGTLDRKSEPPVYTLTYQEFLQWIDSNCTKFGNPKERLLSQPTQEKAGKVFKSVADAVEYLFTNGKPKGTTVKKLYRTGLLSLFPEGATVRFKFSATEKFNTEVSLDLKVVQVRQKLKNKYELPFADGAEKLVMDSDAGKIITANITLWRKAIQCNPLDGESFSQVVAKKDGNDSLVSPEDVRKITICIKDLVNQSNLTPHARVRFTEHLDLLLSPGLSPNLVFEKIGKLREVGYCSAKLFEDFFSYGVSVAKRVKTTIDPRVNIALNRRVMLEGGTLADFIARSFVADHIVISKFGDRNPQDLRDWSSQKEIESSWYLSSNPLESRKHLLLSKSFARLAEKREAGTFRSLGEMTFDEMFLYVMEICKDVGQEPDQIHVINVVKKLLKSSTNPRGILTKLPDGFPA